MYARMKMATLIDLCSVNSPSTQVSKRVHVHVHVGDLVRKFYPKNNQDLTASASDLRVSKSSEALYISTSACRHYNGIFVAFTASILSEI